MLGVDPECVAVAELCHEVSVINDIRLGVSSLLLWNRVFYFIEIIKNIKHKHNRGMV
jgi:hypothetical protein